MVVSIYNSSSFANCIGYDELADLMVFFFSLNLEMQSSMQSYNFELKLNALIISGFEKRIATNTGRLPINLTLSI